MTRSGYSIDKVKSPSRGDVKPFASAMVSFHSLCLCVFYVAVQCYPFVVRVSLYLC
eukprot:m.43551 g.43551  ORF g.43551 m.43551 type:complete len:56 (+) comp10781_c0_seq2:764-931(+)